MRATERESLLSLGRLLQSANYTFTTVTPESHRRVMTRDTQARTCRDVFGWNKYFSVENVSPAMLTLLEEAGQVDQSARGLRSKVRYSTYGKLMFIHSAFPTSNQGSVFFGPDTYRFMNVVRAKLATMDATRLRTVFDVGCGSGAGGIFVRCLIGARDGLKVVLSDINEQALEFSRIGVSLNDAGDIETSLHDIRDGLPLHPDLVISNPPYLVDPEQRLYRDGGGEFGFDLSLQIVSAALEGLTRGGTLILYTGTPVVEGQDLFKAAVTPLIDGPHVSFTYLEVDPDVFGEELDAPPYDVADRIAAVSLVLTKA